jgi:hypothetical protein
MTGWTDFRAKLSISIVAVSKSDKLQAHTFGAGVENHFVSILFQRQWSQDCRFRNLN